MDNSRITFPRVCDPGQICVAQATHFKFLKCSSWPPCLVWGYPVYNRMTGLSDLQPGLLYTSESGQCSPTPDLGDIEWKKFCSRWEKSCGGHRFHLGHNGVSSVPHLMGYCIKGCAFGINQHFPVRRAKPSCEHKHMLFTCHSSCLWTFYGEGGLLISHWA